MPFDKRERRYRCDGEMGMLYSDIAAGRVDEVRAKFASGEFSFDLVADAPVDITAAYPSERSFHRGTTPLIVACVANQEEMVRFLLESPLTNVNAECFIGDTWGINGRAALAAARTGHSAYPYEKQIRILTMLSEAPGQTLNLNFYARDDRTMLHGELWQRNSHIARHLLRCGATALDAKRVSPLHEAISVKRMWAVIKPRLVAMTLLIERKRRERIRESAPWLGVNIIRRIFQAVVDDSVWPDIGPTPPPREYNWNRSDGESSDMEDGGGEEEEDEE